MNEISKADFVNKYLNVSGSLRQTGIMEFLLLTFDAREKRKDFLKDLIISMKMKIIEFQSYQDWDFLVATLDNENLSKSEFIENDFYTLQIGTLDYNINILNQVLNSLNEIVIQQQDNLSYTFNSSLTNKQLEYLLLELIKKGFIDEKTDKKDFYNALTNKPIEYIKNKIKWLKVSRNKQVNKRSIIDFIRLLAEYDLLESSDAKHQKKSNGKLFVKAYNCFADPDGNAIILRNNNIVENEFSANECSEHYKELENIIKALKLI
jgi:hypothetical protein